MNTGLRAKVETAIRGTLAANIERAITACFPETSPDLESQLKTFKEWLVAEAVGPIAGDAYTSLHIPVSARRIRGKVDGQSIRYPKGAIEFRIVISDTAQNNDDVYHLRDANVEVVADQLELGMGNPIMDGLDAAIQQELNYSESPNPTEAEPMQMLEDPERGQPMYFVVDPNGNPRTESAASPDACMAIMEGLGGSLEAGWSLRPEGEELYPAEISETFDVISPDGEVVNEEPLTLDAAEAMRAEWGEGFVIERHETEPGNEEADPDPEYVKIEGATDAEQSEQTSEPLSAMVPQEEGGPKKRGRKPKAKTEPENVTAEQKTEDPAPPEQTEQAPEPASAPATAPVTRDNVADVKRLAAQVLRDGGTPIDASAAAGVPIATIKRWLDDPAFSQMAMSIESDSVE